MSEKVSVWLNGLGLSQHADAFEKNAIVWSLIPKLNHELLKEIGINSVGHRMQILEAAAELDPEQPPATTGVEQAITTGEAERRQLTVMFCDLAGSTELSQQLDPEDLREVNRTYQDGCKESIERYEGYIARYMGDGVLAYFGFPRAHEDDAERAILAGLDIVESMTGLNENFGNLYGISLGVRVGIATGPVVVGDMIGEGASQESAVVGETPNLAARLQGIADIDSVVIGSSTFNLAGGRFDYQDLGSRSIKGIAESVQVWRVIAPSVSESRFDAMHQSDLTPLVGRRHETGLLLERWEYAKEGDGQVVFFSGEPGIGKSRITESLCTHIGADNPAIFRYQCSTYHSNSVLRPVIEQLERAADIKATDPPEIKLNKVEQLTSAAAMRMPLATQIIANMLSITTDDRYPPLQMAPDQLKDEILEALVTQIETSRNGCPRLLIFEDAHWSDPTSLAFLGLLISRAQAMSLLLIITFRLDFTPPWDGPSYITSLRLNRLSRNRAIGLMESVADGKVIPPEVQDQIIEKADGVPLYLEELTKAILESDMLRDNSDPRKRAGSASRISIPDTLHDSLMARLDRSATMREVAQVAAVIGREFSFDMLSAVSALDAEALQNALDMLIDAALVFCKGAKQYNQYIFKHALVQDAAYESLLRANRKSLHARIANVLEQDFPDLAENDPELLAHHYTEANLYEPARQYWLKAGQRSIRQNAHNEAVSQLQRCLEMIEAMPEGEAKARHEIEIRVALGVSFVGKEGGGSPVVGENYRRAHELCLQLNDIEHQYPVLWGLWFHHLMRSNLVKASELADRLLEFSQNLGDEALILESHHCQWAVKYISGDLTSAIEHSNAGTELYRPDKHHGLTYTYGGHDPGACALCVSGISLWLLGYPESSLEKLVQADDLAIELDHTRSLANTLRMSLLVFALRRDLDLLEEKAQELYVLAEADEMLDNLKLAIGLLGWVKFQRGDELEGMAMMRKSLEQWSEQRTPWTAIPISMAAEALGQVGEINEGLELIEDTIAALTSDDVQWTLAELYRIKAGLLLKRDSGSRSEAEAAFRQAIEVARTQKAKSLELRAAAGLTEIMLGQDMKDEARNIIVPVYEWFSEGFDTPDLIEARRILEQLA